MARVFVITGPSGVGKGTLIRTLLKNGERIPGYLRKDVEDYIRKHGLYGARTAGNVES